MKIINLDSKYDLSPAQVHYAYSVALNGNDSHPKENDSIVHLMDEIPIYLLGPDSMPEFGKFKGEKPSTEWLGFYQHQSSIHGVYTPSIGLCPERIAECVETEWELMVLIAKVIIHEFAHAQMRRRGMSNYSPIDEFFEWMEEPIANLITLHHFKNSSRAYYHGWNENQVAHVETDLKPLDYVQDFISRQPDNYRLGLDLYEHLFYWRFWASKKEQFQKRTNEKNAWLRYVKANVGKTDSVILNQLFDDLWKSN
jgi:hypothetical protein